MEEFVYNRDINLSLIQSRYGGNRYGRYLMICCPFHPDENPSCQVYPDRYYCLACGANGYTSELISTSKKPLSKREYKRTYNPFSRWLQNETLTQALSIAWELNCKRPCKYMRKKRGISNENQKKFGLGFRENWITFPILDSGGSIIGATARAGEGNTSPVRYMSPRGQDPNMLYIPSWKLIDKYKTVYLTFGIIDALVLAILGKPAMSTTSGKHVNPSAFNWHRGNIAIVPDLGEESEAYNLKYKLGIRGKVCVIDYPIGTKDIADLYATGEILHELDGCL